MVLIYIVEGMGLVRHSDWIAYSLPVMRHYTLLGGFSIGVCQCYASLNQSQYGYYDQLFENAGIVMCIDGFVLLVLGILFGAYKSKYSDNINPH